MTILCYLFAYIFEQFVSYIYFRKKFTQKVTNGYLLLSYALSFIIQFSINFADNSYLNLLSFFICNFVIAYVCYYSSIRQVLFNVLLLEGLMIITELIIIYAATLLFKINLEDYSADPYIFTLETIGTKTLYFLLAYIFSRISFKEKKDVVNKDYSYLLFVLPLTSVILIMSLVYVSVNLDLDQTANTLFMIITFLSLMLNIIVFLVHERIISTLTQNTELQLEKQKGEINREYYTELEKQYDLSNILVHDIKNCLINIREFSVEGDNQKIIEYVDSIYNGYEISSLKQYSSNKLTNVIISRYAQLCNDNSIDFTVDIRNADFSFITDSDLTALLDNLLENAFEAAKSSVKKQIGLTVDTKNENYILFNIINSSDTEPKKVGNSYVSTKKSKDLHGIGLNSVSRIVKKYSGNLECTYNAGENTFKTSVLLKHSKG